MLSNPRRYELKMTVTTVHRSIVSVMLMLLLQYYVEYRRKELKFTLNTTES